MNKKAIKSIIAFIKMLKAPAQMIPYIVSLVITVIRRHTDDDKAALVNIKQQGFVCRKSNEISGGCGSPAVAVNAEGGADIVFACSRVVDGALIYSLCHSHSKNKLKISPSDRRFIFDSPMQIGNVTATSTPYGVLISWRTKLASSLHVPSYEKAVVQSCKNKNAELFAALSPEEKAGGTYYAFLPDKNGELNIKKAPCEITQGAIMLSDNELLWMGTENGVAVVYKTVDKCNSFTKIGSVPAIPGGRLVSQVSCAKIKNGRLICIFSSMGELFISYSDDMGVRWSLPHMLNVKGISPNICMRDDGIMALTYVQPEKKVSIRSMISLDGQYKWLEERALVISTADNCRRPYTVSFDSNFYTVSRQRFAGDRESSVVFTMWTPHPDDEKLIEDNTEDSKKKAKKKNGK
ncbi:MAG: exo-alpha-sialidase [Clostridia bacterium]|nr:exo-alpha-sialidase [Clostridia bacterium]